MIHLNYSINKDKENLLPSILKTETNIVVEKHQNIVIHRETKTIILLYRQTNQFNKNKNLFLNNCQLTCFKD
jgi:hypothetical protein